jgi:MFS superfamily sulfate permease-like transporter
MVESAGGHSQLSQLTTSFIVLIVLLFFTGPLAYMPAAVLSSVVFLICVELVDIKGMYKIYRERPWEFWVALITAAVVIFVGVEQSIILAIFLSLVVHTRHGYRPNNMIIVPDEPQGGWLLKPVRVQEQTMPALIIYRFMHNMYYANMQALTEEVVTLARGANPPLSWFCIDLVAVDDLDFTAAETLRTLHGILAELDIRLVFSELMEGVRKEFARSNLTELFGTDAFYSSLEDVMSAFRQRDSERR